MDIPMRRLLALLLSLAACTAHPRSAVEYLPADANLDDTIPTPESVLGWDVGDWHVGHDALVNYLYHLADASPRVTIREIGRSNEQRPLLQLLISSPANLDRSEELRQANLDGAGFFSIYTRIIFPLSIPGFVVTSLWQFTQIWNEFLWGICLTRHTSNPITVGLAQLAGGQAVSWNLPMAGSILAALPVLLIYIVLGRYFIRGLLAGSVKE
mgnify:CR=1 FL=1